MWAVLSDHVEYFNTTTSMEDIEGRDPLSLQWPTTNLSAFANGLMAQNTDINLITLPVEWVNILQSDICNPFASGSASGAAGGGKQPDLSYQQGKGRDNGTKGSDKSYRATHNDR